LQQLLQSMGLQITFVTCERMLQKNWKSGRFTILMTELACQPFTTFMIDEDEEPSDRPVLIRGVFNLEKSIGFNNKPAEYSHWHIGQLDAQSKVSELTTIMMPWIKEQQSEIPNCNKVTHSNITENHLNAKTLVRNSLISFNFDRYIKHQGSAELAIFMLQEYTSENTLLVDKLCQEFRGNNTEEVETTIHKLLVNSKILAADDLLSLCKSWRELLTTQAVDNNDKVQISLLSKTKEAVLGITQYADTIA